jgi:hypothetical protein
MPVFCFTSQWPEIYEINPGSNRHFRKWRPLGIAIALSRKNVRMVMRKPDE